MACSRTRPSGGSNVGVGVIDGVRDGRGVSVGGPEGVGVSLAVAETECVGAGVSVGGIVAVAVGGNGVRVKVGVAVGISVGAAKGRPGYARPATKPTASAAAPMIKAMSRLRLTVSIYSPWAVLTRVPKSGWVRRGARNPLC